MGARGTNNNFENIKNAYGFDRGTYLGLCNYRIIFKSSKTYGTIASIVKLHDVF